jgi:hypothetical protein
MADTTSQHREAVRAALTEYRDHVSKAVDDFGTNGRWQANREHFLVLKTQAESAMQILWMD